MKEYKGVLISITAGICAIICTAILVVGFVSYKKTAGSGGITATGSANCDFESDLIVWRGSFSAYGQTTTEAYDILKNDAQMIKEYLQSNNVGDDEMIFNAVNINQRYSTRYSDAGDIIGDYPDGYDLYQEVTVTSNDVDKVEKISRDITKLIESGVEFTSNEPEYYYTKLDELKLKLIEEATKNAKQRVDIMATGTGEKAGKLTDATLGVFQITAKNSSDEDYSYGGTFNTSSREKTATITVKLNYTVK